MAEITYREAIAAGLTQEMARDESVVLIGEDVGVSGGVFKATAGLFERFGPRRVRDTPICEQAILGAAMGAAMTGLRPVAEIMFGDFLSVCHDLAANQIAKIRYMTAGQVSVPLVVRFGNGGGLHFGAQHSQSVESWLMAVPGLKVVVPSTPADVIGLMAAAVRDPDPVMVCEEKALYPLKGEIPECEHVDELGSAVLRREGSDATIVAIGTMVHRALAAAEELEREGVEVEVVDLRSLVPLDVTTVAESVAKTARLFTVEENPRLCGWGAELASIIGEECFNDLDAPIRRITTPHVPLPAADSLEDAAIPSAARVAEVVRRGLG
ncbi:MAG: alpha-ketoacid dehydrogenase subunit beta [Acidimicrobiales bacterium]|jgi:pyruvate dehydrogenase E1 component beta subunit